MTDPNATTHIDSARLWADIMNTSPIGRHPTVPTGMQRLSLSDADAQIRAWFIARGKELGCEVRFDEAGNIFLVWSGGKEGEGKGEGARVRFPERAPVGVGSHLDTQPAGGRFDGILGVMAGLEVLRVVRERGMVLNRPLAVIDWTNEEGARFPVMCSGSSYWAGTKTLEEVYALKDLSDPEKTFGSELKRIGFDGSLKPKDLPLAAHFELHIEQASRLEKAEQNVGVVTGVQGMRWLKVLITGKEGHAGSTYMSTRQDALVAASKLVLFVEEEANKVDAFGTVGHLKPRTEAPNTIVGEVSLIIDIRHPSDDTLDKLQGGFDAFMKRLQVEQGFTYHMERIWDSPAVIFNETAIDCVRKAASKVSQKFCNGMISFAGHDSAETGRVCPTAMIFVRSEGGISHNPAEYTSQEDCAAGAETLLHAVLEYDKYLGDQ